MRFIKWAGLFAVVLLVVSCFTPWVVFESLNRTISGAGSTGTDFFGKPGYVHFIFAFFFILLHFIPKLWAKRWNILVVALNIAWAIRNFIIISMCRDGECPEIQTGLYLVIAASAIMLVSALFPDIKLNNEKKS